MWSAYPCRVDKTCSDVHTCVHACTCTCTYICTCICDPPWQNQPYCTQDRFWVKATITKYDLWTTDPANLKSLTPVSSEIWAKMYPDRPYKNFTASAMKHCHVRCTRKSVYSPFMPSTWPRPQSQWASWLPERLNESSSRRFDGKGRIDKRF